MRRSALALAAVALLGSTLAGCGGSSSDAAPTQSVAPTSAPVSSTGTSDGSLDICSLISSTDVDRIVGGTTTVEPTGDGCTFRQDDATAETVALTPTPYDAQLGGMVSTKAALASVFDGGTPKDVPRIGDDAFVIVGSAKGGTGLQGAGAVQVGSTVVVATIVQASGLTAGVLRTEMTDLLTLVADKAP